MALTVRIPTYLAGFAGGSSVLSVESGPENVRELLDALWQAHPSLRDRIVDEQGQLRQHVNIFVGDEAVAWNDGLESKVPDGVEVLIVPAVSGG
ncbi:MAG TPA: ubiquitin-like small modifier protein 1 [Candidatus Limnocylindrales bacterium]|nr:ubiquitin-like small modifier protein 1 [Candidatus Limnocylindrales bacterium]